jgi:hypothetical protein
MAAATSHFGRLSLGGLCPGEERIDRIAQFYAIEDKARLAPPDERLAHRTAVIPLLGSQLVVASAVVPHSDVQPKILSVDIKFRARIGPKHPFR